METVYVGKRQMPLETLREMVVKMARSLRLPYAEADDAAQEICIVAWQTGRLEWKALWNVLRNALTTRRRHYARFLPLGEEDFAVEHKGFRDVDSADEMSALTAKCLRLATHSKRRPCLWDWAAIWLVGGDDGARGAWDLWIGCPDDWPSKKTRMMRRLRELRG